MLGKLILDRLLMILKGLKTQNGGCFDMYMFIYRKKTEESRNGNLSVVFSYKDNWKDALCDYIAYKDDQMLDEIDLNTLKLFKKALSNLPLNEAIQLMYLVYGDGQILLDMFDNVRRVDFGQISPDPDGSNAPS
nr:MAG TPA: hypothetical protein [Caudoviricetes sp.]